MADLDTQKMFTRIEGKLGKIEGLLEDDHKALHGNGHPGLIERVAKLEVKVGIVAALAGFVASVIASGVAEVVKLIVAINN